MKHSFLSLAIIVLACASLAAGQDAKAAGKLDSTDAQFVQDALASGHHEIEMAQKAINQSKDAQVKSFATSLVNDHTAANKKLEEIAGVAAPAPDSVPATTDDLKSDINNRSNEVADPHNVIARSQSAQPVGARPNAGGTLTPSPATDSRKEGNPHMDSHIEATLGANFDNEWARQMVEDHKTAIAKFEAQENQTKNAALRDFVSTTLPTLKEHLAKAQALDK